MDASSATDATASEDPGPPPYNHKPVVGLVVDASVSPVSTRTIEVSEPQSPTELVRAALALVRGASPEFHPKPMSELVPEDPDPVAETGEPAIAPVEEQVSARGGEPMSGGSKMYLLLGLSPEIKTNP